MDKKTRRIEIRVTEDEYTALQNLAKHYDITVSSYLRRLAFQGTAKDPFQQKQENFAELVSAGYIDTMELIRFFNEDNFKKLKRLQNKAKNKVELVTTD